MLDTVDPTHARRWTSSMASSRPTFPTTKMKGDDKEKMLKLHDPVSAVSAVSLILVVSTRMPLRTWKLSSVTAKIMHGH